MGLAALQMLELCILADCRSLDVSKKISPFSEACKPNSECSEKQPAFLSCAASGSKQVELRIQKLWKFRLHEKLFKCCAGLSPDEQEGDVG